MTFQRRGRWLPVSGLLGAVFSFSLVGACDSSKDGQSCNSSADCGAGVCRDRICVAPCTSNEACAGGQLCNPEFGICYTPSMGVAGAPVSVAGSSSTAGASVGGALGIAGDTAGGTGGTAGSPAAGGTGGTGGSGPNLTYELIDDLEDNDARILQNNGRQGPWHIFNDQGNGGNQQPSNSNFLPEKGGANGTMYAVHTTGEGFGFAGVGFDLNNAETTPESSKSQPFDASGWDGIAFWAKGTASLRVEIPTRNFVPQDRGGSCSNDCWNVYGADLPGGLDADWREYRVPFSSLKRESGSTEPAFARDQLMSVSFRHNGNARFDFWIDEVRFYSESGGPVSNGGAPGSGGAPAAAGAAGVSSGGESAGASTGGTGS